MRAFFFSTATHDRNIGSTPESVYLVSFESPQCCRDIRDGGLRRTQCRVEMISTSTPSISTRLRVVPLFHTPRVPRLVAGDVVHAGLRGREVRADD
jgi:hypothetical protein